LKVSKLDDAEWNLYFVVLHYGLAAGGEKGSGVAAGREKGSGIAARREKGSGVAAGGGNV
jgi:hypothetical protein